MGLNIEDEISLESCRWGGLKSGLEIEPGDGLFPRVQKPKAVSPEKKKAEDARIEYDDFAKLKLKTAKVISAEKVEGTDKLLKLRIDLGDEQRQIVAGVAQHYTPEQMVGKTLVIIANLKPAKIRGVESDGMLLAAKSGKELVLISTDTEIPPGAAVS